MSSIQDLISKRDALNAQIELARKEAVKAAIEQARALVADYSLTSMDVFGKGSRRPGKARAPVKAKYRDLVTGATWSGRGLVPKWMQGKDRSEFLIRE